MKRRFPLWLTLIPLIAATFGYYWYWSGQRDAFRKELASALPGKTVEIGGFPYRLEARVERPERVSRASDIAATATAASAVLNRGPFQRNLTIVRSVEPRVAARVSALTASNLTVAAPAAQSSVHLDKGGRVARLSTIFEKPRVDLALLGAPLTATTLEVHVREFPGRIAEPWSPTLPERAQVVLAGDGVRIGGGAPLRLAADLRVTGPAPLVDFARWAGKGSVQVRGLTLADATGEVLRLDATMLAAGGRPQLAGTVVTVCPMSIAAALAGVRVSEQRLRIAVKLPLTGTPGAWTLGALPPATRAVRAQLPACPALR